MLLVAPIAAARLSQRLRPARLAEAYRSEVGLAVGFPVEELLYLICDAGDLRLLRSRGLQQR